MARTSGWVPRIAFIRSMPVPSGSWRSTSMIWGRTRPARRTPSATEPASATTCMPSARSMISAMPRRTTSWSSTIITVITAARSAEDVRLLITTTAS